MTPPGRPEGVAHRGLLYRALNPVYARDPLSGEGARLHGGRFNARGTLALYLSLSPATALREANQVGTLQPTTLVAYRADLAPFLDGRDADALACWNATPDDLADPDWRARMLEGRPGRCCANPVGDSPCAFSLLAAWHEQTSEDGLQDHELVCL